MQVIEYTVCETLRLCEHTQLQRNDLKEEGCKERLTFEPCSGGEIKMKQDIALAII
jgi:hypothetical protein